MHKRKTLMGLLALALALGSSVAVAAPAAKPAAAKPAAAKPAKPPDKKTEEKVNYYIRMMNRESDSVLETRSHWLAELADPKAGPTCKEQNLNSGAGFGTDWEDRFKQYKKQFQAKPKLETDEAALKMVEALEELVKPTAELSEVLEYRNRKNADRCTKLQALHPRLMAGWNKYRDNLAILGDFVEKFTDERDLRELDTTAKKYGKRYRYHFARLIVEAKALFHAAELQTRNVASGNVDTAPIVEKLKLVTTTREESKKLMADDHAAKKNDTYPPGISLLLHDSLPNLEREVERYVELLNDKKKRENPKMLRPSWEHFVDDYNKLVQQMNGVGFDKNQK